MVSGKAAKSTYGPREESEAYRSVQPDQNVWGEITVRTWINRVFITHMRWGKNRERCALDAAHRQWLSFLDSDEYTEKTDYDMRRAVRERMLPKRPLRKLKRHKSQQQQQQ